MFGRRAGNTDGSFCEPSNVSVKSTASASMSASSIASATDRSRHSVYRIAAGGSASSDPKFPCPSTSCADIEKSCAMRTSASYTDWSPCGWNFPKTSPTTRAHFLNGFFESKPSSCIA
eukprot:31532-Pelagococcus_subviridis.AAC.1